MTTYRFVATPYAATGGAGVGNWDPRDIAVSNDGATWTALRRNTSIVTTTGAELPFYRIKYANGIWFGALSTSSNVYNTSLFYSTNLLDWFPSFRNTGSGIGTGAGLLLDNLKYENGVYLTNDEDNTWRSTGVTGWASTRQVGTQSQIALNSGNGIFGIALFRGGTFNRSTNGTTWLSTGISTGITTGGVDFGVSTSSAPVKEILYAGLPNAWLIVGTNGVSVSYDAGNTWTPQNNFQGLGLTGLTQDRIHSAALFPGDYFVVGYTINIATGGGGGGSGPGPGGTTPEHKIAWSPDGVDWYVEDVPVQPLLMNTAKTLVGNNVILISDQSGNVPSGTWGNNSIGEGNPWTLTDLGTLTADPNNLNRLGDLDDNFPDPSQPFTTVGADAEGYTSSSSEVIVATLRYDAPVVTGQDNLTLYRVSKDYRYSKTGEVFPAMPQTDDGLPFYTNIFDPDFPGTVFSTQPGTLPYRYEIVEEWGKIAVFINGVDVTFFREAPTIIESISWQTFGNFEAASFYFPMITQYDKLAESTPTTTSGTGGGILSNAISWLTDDATIEIKRIKPDDSLETIWLGSVNGLELDSDGSGMRVIANGLLYEANHQLLPGKYQDSVTITARDTGIIAAEVLNSIDGKWSYVEPVETGVTTIKSPDWDNALDFLRNLNSIGSPEIWIDTDYKAYVTGRPMNSDRRYTTFDVIAGQDGIVLDVQYDSSASPTVIYGRGRQPSGTEWRNVVYPAAPVTFFNTSFPLDFSDATLKNGMLNTDTVTRDGISTLWYILRDNGYLPVSVGFTRRFNDTMEAAVRRAQADYGLDVTGEVDTILWSRLIGIGDITDNAYIEPLYVSPLIDPSSPSYDPTVRRVEQYIDFGDNLYVDDAKQVAQRIIERDMIQYTVDAITPKIWKQRKSVTGTVTMTMDPIETVLGGIDVSRWDLKPGDSIRIIPHIFAPIQDDKHDAETNTRWEAGDSGGSLLLYIKRIEWSFSGTPTATLEVSTRNLEYNELDAAQSRIKISNAEKTLDQKAKKGSGKTAR